MNENVQFCVVPFCFKDLACIAESTEEKNHQVDEESFILEIYQDGFGPTMKIKNVHTETIQHTHEKDGPKSTLQRNF